jgi:putative NADH-flavin reductase
MKILVFGATGTTGRLLIQEALANGHSVTAFVRDPARLNVKHPQLQCVVGDVMNQESVSAAMLGHDAILCALGVLPGSKADANRSQRSVPVCSVGTGQILASMERTGVKRIVVQSASCIGEGRKAGRFGSGHIVRFVMRDIMNDKERQETLIKSSQTDWTIVRPVKLVEGTKTGQVLSGTNLSWSLASEISFADVAAFMVKALSDATTVHHALTIRLC